MVEYRKQVIFLWKYLPGMLSGMELKSGLREIREFFLFIFNEGAP